MTSELKCLLYGESLSVCVCVILPLIVLSVYSNMIEALGCELGAFDALMELEKVSNKRFGPSKLKPEHHLLRT